MPRIASFVAMTLVVLVTLAEPYYAAIPKGILGREDCNKMTQNAQTAR